MNSTSSAASLLPRWEWRTFAGDLAGIRQKLPDVSAVAAKHSRETYLLVPSASHNAKIRFEVLDVKRLLETDANGLQLWTPVFKEPFPLGASAIAGLFELLAVPCPVLLRQAYTLSQFLDEIAGGRTGMRTVTVEKIRRGFEFSGCIAEIADVAFDGKRAETFCLEHHDRSFIAGGLDALGLRGARNISYPQAIREAVGVGAIAA